MLRLRLVWLWSLTFVLACSTVLADDENGQAMLDKATETKLSAENAADLNEVIKLCQGALEAGLDDANKQFANELLASSLTQRAEMVCLELFERPMTPSRGRRLVQMALSDLEETIKIDPDQAEAQYLLGRLYSHLGEPIKGLKAINEAVRLSEKSPATRAKALLVRANLKTEAAEREADYDEAVKLTPQDPDTLRFRGLFLLTLNKLDAAIADFNAAIALEPEDPDTYEARGLAQSLAQKYDDAMESFNKTLELQPNSPTALVHRSRVRAIKGDAPAALQDANQAIELQPGSAQALMLRATLLSSLGKFDEALVDLNLLRRALPDNPEILLQIAAVYQAAKRPDEAVGTYNHLLLSDPESSAALRGRADAYLSLGKQAEAIADYEHALKLEPKNSGVLNNLAWVLATSPEEPLRNGVRAIELAKQACEATDYKQAHILSTLAAGYAEAGDFESAINWSKKAVELGTEQLKDQLTKELESYQAGKPWREALPPVDEAEAEKTAKPDKGSAPDSDDTARAKDETRS